MSRTRKADLIVVGGGPAGLSAAVAAGSHGARVVVVESDHKSGGQLVKQTHKFFGSREEFAGTRGNEIASRLMAELESLADRVQILNGTTVTGYYREEELFSAMREEREYFLIDARRAVVATGAQERIVPFAGNDLPGVYGAGAVQTLMNVYGVVPGDRVLMVGAGNIGLIVSYQLRQAGVEVAAVLEAAPKVGGYWVHAAKIRRLGIPILLRHTVLEAIGDDRVEAAQVSRLDERFRPVGERLTVPCDLICMAVGLTPSTELFWQAGCEMRYVGELCGHVPLRDANMRTSNPGFWVAGDAAGIEEASAAMIEGRLAGLDAACSLGLPVSVVEMEALRGRLANLRAGEKGCAIRSGLGRICIEEWEGETLVGNA